MESFFRLLRGFKGHPAHPPFTDFSVGAYTVGTLAVVLGAFGVDEELMVRVGFFATLVGLIAAVPTALTGLADYVRIRRGTPMRRTATIHRNSMVTATVIYVASALLLRDGYDSGSVSAADAAVSAIAWVVLAFGAWVGGSMVFVYGMRVLSEPGTPTSEALKPKFPKG
jgi:uncharacterized membrane protein